MLKRSTLTDIAELIQNELDAYSQLSGLSFDVLDENMSRIAGNGLSNYIPGERVQNNFSLAEHAKRTRQPIFILGRTNSLCARCDFRDSCIYLADAAYPLFLDNRCAGVICAHCNDTEVLDRIRASEKNYRDLISQLAEIISALAKGVIDGINASTYKDAVTGLVQSSDAPIILMRNRRISDLSESAASYVRSASGGTMEINTGSQVSVLLSRRSSDITLKTSDDTADLTAEYRLLPAELPFCDRLELIRADRNVIPSKPVFQDSISQVSIDYLQGTSEGFEAFKRSAVSLYNTSRFIFLEGERGLGKETWARAIHNSSERSSEELIILDCNSFFDLTFANNVFDENEGMISRHHVTICLKEVSKLSPWLQRKLVDSAPVLSANDIRIIATSTDSAEELVRMNIMINRLYMLFYPAFLRVPPIRERHDDMEFYIDDCIDKYKVLDNRKIRITKAAKAKLMSYTWPGNLMQLEHTMGFLITNNTTGTITDKDVAAVPDLTDGSTELNLRQNEKSLIKEALLKYTGPNGKLAAAQALGISKATLYRKMKEYGLD